MAPDGGAHGERARQPVAPESVASRRGRLRLFPAAGFGACPAHPDLPPAPRPVEETAEGARRCQRWTLSVVCLASALLLFNVTAPNVALPAIANDLSAGFDAQQWVLSSYALVLGSFLLLGGALGDRYGRRRLFLFGLTVYFLGSLACALATSTGVLIAGRLVQGIGAAALFPSGLALIAAEFAGAARARAIGMWGASVAGAIALGPLVGGVLVETSGWRAQFGLTVILVVPTAVVAARHLRESRATGSARLDWAGTGLLTGALVLFIVLVQRGNAVGWLSATTLGMAGAALVCFVGFLAIEFRVANPLIAPEVMRNPTFVGATAVALVFAAAGFAPLVYLTLFLLRVAGSGPILAGAQLAPFAVASLLVSLLAARIARRVGARTTLVLGFTLCAAGLALLLNLHPDSGVLRLLPGLILFGAGGGLVNPTMTVAALSTVDAAHSGMASGVNNTARQIGIAAGIAGLGAVMENRLFAGIGTALADNGVPAPTAQLAGRLAADDDLEAAGRLLGAEQPSLGPIYATAFSHALTVVCVVAIAISVCGGLVAIVLMRPKRKPQQKIQELPQERPRETNMTTNFFVIADAEGEPTQASCAHLGQINDASPSTKNGCEDCLREGSRWVHLRRCLECGHIGCCDSSPRRHASQHWHATSHPLVQSFEPDEDWAWCYADQLLLSPTAR